MIRSSVCLFASLALVAIGAGPVPPTEDVQLERLWVLDSEDTLIGTVDGIVVRSDRIYVLDAWLRRIIVLSLHGQLQGTFGRTGEGPGEYRNPIQLLSLAKDRLGVVDRSPPKLAILGPDGTPIEDFRLGPSTEFIWSAQSAGDAIIVRCVQRFLNAAPRHIVHRLRRCATGTVEGVTYVEETMPIPVRGEMIVPETLPAAVWALGENGHVYVSSNYEEYRIRVFTSDGSELNQISRSYEHVEYTKDEYEQHLESRKDIAHLIGLYAKPSKYYRDIQAMHSRADGSLWVQPSDGKPDPKHGVLGVFDVFDDRQAYARRVRVLAPFDPEEDQYYIVADRLFVVERGQDARRAMHATSKSEDTEDADSNEPVALRLVCYDFPLGELKESN